MRAWMHRPPQQTKMNCVTFDSLADQYEGANGRRAPPRVLLGYLPRQEPHNVGQRFQTTRKRERSFTGGPGTHRERPTPSHAHLRKGCLPELATNSHAFYCGRLSGKTFAPCAALGIHVEQVMSTPLSKKRIPAMCQPDPHVRAVGFQEEYLLTCLAWPYRPIVALMIK